MPSQPLVGGFKTGLEGFDVPYSGGSGSSGSIGSGSSGAASAAAAAMSDRSDSGSESDGMIGGQSMEQAMASQMQMAKTKEDFQRMVQQARFFLPNTLKDIATQHGAQGSYWSSGRRTDQQEAAKKTYFDLAQAKSDADFQMAMQMLESQSGRSSG